MCWLSKLQIPQKPECLSPTLSLQTLLGTLPYPHRNYRWIMWVATLRSHVSNILGLPLQTGKSISHKAQPPFMRLHSPLGITPTPHKLLHTASPFPSPSSSQSQICSVQGFTRVWDATKSSHLLAWSRATPQSSNPCINQASSGKAS